MENLIVPPLALVIDLVFGEYPACLHPVVWMGGIISLLLKPVPRHNPTAQFIYGIVIVLLAVALFAVPVYFLLAYLNDVSKVAYVITAAVLLKSTFSIKALNKAALNIKRLLAEDKLAEVRQEMGYLVSRDTSGLDKPQITSAAVEMSAESVTDGIVAPLFYWLLLGVPGAIAFRVVNTFDSRIGYHGEYEYLGKFAARLDDVLNYLPARLAGLLLVLAAYIRRQNSGRAWRIMLRDRNRTASPNAGWAMSAVAGALGVRLEKPGHYRLGDNDTPLSPASITTGLGLATLSSLMWFAACIAISGVYYAVAA